MQTEFERLMAWLGDTRFLNVSLANWGGALLASLACYLALTLGLRFLGARVRALSVRTPGRLDDALADLIDSTHRGLVLLVSLLVGASMLELPVRWASRVEHLWFIAVAVQLALWLNRAVSLVMTAYVARHSTKGTQSAGASATLLSWSLRIVLWSVLLLAMLSNLGVNITAFVASLGVGGVAVALAVQNILGDLFASLSIAVDKPFEVDDAIAFGNFSGSVEAVGLKTTRIRATSGEQIIVSNTELLKQTISNYKRMHERRIAFKFGVSHATTPEQAGRIPGIVKQIIESSDKLRFDRAHLLSLGPNSLDYEVVYFVRTPDYGLYMDLQQTINLRLLEELARLGTSLALPTSRIELVRQPAPQAGPVATPP